jgi:hypothetical protein
MSTPEGENEPAGADSLAGAPESKPDAEATPESVKPELESEGMTHAELSAHVLHVSGRSRNVEEPLGTAQWPTGQLSPKETKLLADAIRRLRAA